VVLLAHLISCWGWKFKLTGPEILSQLANRGAALSGMEGVALVVQFLMLSNELNWLTQRVVFPCKEHV
jgi:hypothetical protein